MSTSPSNVLESYLHMGISAEIPMTAFIEYSPDEAPSMKITLEKHKEKAVKTTWIICENDECKRASLIASLHTYHKSPDFYPRSIGLNVSYSEPLKSWQLLPTSKAKQFPDYIPLPIRQDYEEAYLILELSPKASATLSRRCLQGMIRDFHGIQDKRTLNDEIRAIREKVDPSVLLAIDAVREIGNIGAHMEKDINLIIDVDPNEAKSLIALNEMLLKEWYIHRYERNKQLEAIIGINAQKQSERKEKP